MRLVLDTCVLYPSVMRAVLIGAAGQGFFQPVWSPRILEEWRRAAVKLGPLGAAQAEGEIALLRAAWPQAERAHDPGLEARLWLPDPADIHVLALAVGASADGIVTVNARDFPRGTLAEQGLARMDPDGLLHGFWQARPEAMQAVGAEVLAEANRANAMPAGGDAGGWTMRALLKKARLPRLGKALG